MKSVLMQCLESTLVGTLQAGSEVVLDCVCFAEGAEDEGMRAWMTSVLMQ
jgi:hypothetical protein